MQAEKAKHEEKMRRRRKKRMLHETESNNETKKSVKNMVETTIWVTKEERRYSNSNYGQRIHTSTNLPLFSVHEARLREMRWDPQTQFPETGIMLSNFILLLFLLSFVCRLPFALLRFIFSLVVRFFHKYIFFKRE